MRDIEPRPIQHESSKGMYTGIAFLLFAGISFAYVKSQPGENFSYERSNAIRSISSEGDPLTNDAVFDPELCIRTTNLLESTPYILCAEVEDVELTINDDGSKEVIIIPSLGVDDSPALENQNMPTNVEPVYDTAYSFVGSYINYLGDENNSDDEKRTLISSICADEAQLLDVINTNAGRYVDAGKGPNKLLREDIEKTYIDASISIIYVDEANRREFTDLFCEEDVVLPPPEPLPELDSTTTTDAPAPSPSTTIPRPVPDTTLPAPIPTSTTTTSTIFTDG